MPLQYRRMSATEVKAGFQNLEQFLLLAKSTKGAALAALLKQLLESPGVYVFGEVLDMPNVREMSATEVKAGFQNLEQFLLLAKSTKGAALAALLKQLLESPGVYVFGEVLDMPNVRELESGPHASVYQLLNLFAYGTYCDYKENASSLPELSAAQKNKLRHLSIVTLAANLKVSNLQKTLKASSSNSSSTSSSGPASAAANQDPEQQAGEPRNSAPSQDPRQPTGKKSSKVKGYET
ncbi:UNVERIFIED_CONTAM: hypothetical protein FKN15_002907 [Acipenser sinensis]